jgi:uncharacterized membrane protein YeiH
MIGNFLIIDLIAATTNALNGALLARQPSHYRKYTIMGIILIAIATGVAGGISRDVILNTIPGALKNPAYIILCIAAGITGLLLNYFAGARLQHGFLQFLTAFSLPWYATQGASKALDADLRFWPAILIGVIGATAGRFVLDIVSGVTPLQFVKSEFFVGSAVISASVFVARDWLGLSIWPATLIAFAFGFAFRLAANGWRWEEPMPRTPRDEPKDRTEASVSPTAAPVPRERQRLGPLAHPRSSGRRSRLRSPG